MLAERSYLKISRVGRIPASRTTNDGAEPRSQVIREILYGSYSGIVLGISANER